MHRNFLSLMAAALILTQGACGGGGVTSPSPLGSSSPSTVPTRLAGTCRGGSSNMSFVWQLTQDGQSIVGSSRIAGSGGWSGADGRVVGTIDGSTFVFDETHSPGTLSIAGCSAQLHGRLGVTTFTPPITRPPSPERNNPVITLPPFSAPPPTRMSMSGSVSGHGCAGDFDTTIVLSRD